MLESPAAASSLPPGENATDLTVLMRPGRVRISYWVVHLWTDQAMSGVFCRSHC